MSDPRDVPVATEPEAVAEPDPMVAEPETGAEPGSMVATEPEPGAPARLPEPDSRSDTAAVPGHRPSGSISQATPTYKGQPLDEARGPGLGCFWTQVLLLGFLLVFTPLTVVWAWDSRISAILLIITLLLLLFAGNTVIFLMRLVAADRRGRRRPLSETARKTVGQLEEQTAAPAQDPPVDQTPA